MEGCCVCAKCSFEFGAEQYECGRVAQPDAGVPVDGGDWDRLLGGFTVSGAAEEVSCGDAGEGATCVEEIR